MQNEDKYTIDTNFLMSDFQTIFEIESDVIIPLTVIKELDNHKTDKKGDNSFNVRRSLNIINEAMDNNSTLPNGFKLFIDSNEYPNIEKNDDKIIQVAIDNNSILATKDVGMKVKAKAIGVRVKFFNDSSKDEAVSPGDVETITVDYDYLQDFYQKRKLPINTLGKEKVLKNSCYLLKSECGTASALIRRIGDWLIHVKPPEKVYDIIHGRNVAQKHYLDMLMDKRIKVIIVNGRAGSGKTLLALAAGFHQVRQNRFKRIICAKSVEEVGQGIGYRPGDETDKLKPFYAAFEDNIEYLCHTETKTGKLRRDIEDDVYYEHIGYMRGRTFSESFIILDEAQNLKPGELKTAITRIGEGSKIIICGDIEQIDNNLTKYSNGLYDAQRKLVNNNIVGVITLDKCERSAVAALGELL